MYALSIDTGSDISLTGGTQDYILFQERANIAVNINETSFKNHFRKILFGKLPLENRLRNVNLKNYTNEQDLTIPIESNIPNKIISPPVIEDSIVLYDRAQEEIFHRSTTIPGKRNHPQ